jgi:acetylglutamate kinase
VGVIDEVRPQLIVDLIEKSYIPVVAPIAKTPEGEALNVNADTAAGEIAAALGAAKLMLMTDVEGVKDGNGNLLRSLRAKEARALIADGTISGGMIPKVECALDAAEGGVEKVHIVDGRRIHALLLEIFTDRGVGSEIHQVID